MRRSLCYPALLCRFNCCPSRGDLDEILKIAPEPQHAAPDSRSAACAELQLEGVSENPFDWQKPLS
jgi:hypothetical protein